eukprot:TRINITY_DN10813_c0_g1_i1.p1 TRINITY_DN10813_c0_g1~~TRINITY_DN10813_c0_g1_i1.p1  ORF type:complete len:238 (-),score=73.62 TRINITY_DN10813_c0_g1_i1:193-906(-)
MGGKDERGKGGKGKSKGKHSGYGADGDIDPRMVALIHLAGKGGGKGKDGKGKDGKGKDSKGMPPYAFAGPPPPYGFGGFGKGFDKGFSKGFFKGFWPPPPPMFFKGKGFPSKGFFKGTGPVGLMVDPKLKVWFGNLPEAVDWKALQTLVDKVGKSKWVEVFTGKGKGTAAVSFATEEDAASVVKSLHDTEFMGSKIAVEHWKRGGDGAPEAAPAQADDAAPAPAPTGEDGAAIVESL